MAHVIIWTIIGIGNMIGEKRVSRLSYFLCWLMLMVVLIERIVLAR